MFMRVLGLAFCVLIFASNTMAEDIASFLAAKPVWPVGREKEMNVTVGYRAVFDAPKDGKAVLRIAAASIYRAWLNGEFLACGPARGPHGFYRVDVLDLAGKLKPGKNLLAIEVAGYNSNSYYLLDQPSFLQAEVTAGDQVLASTAGKGAPFNAFVLNSRVQKTQRYSFQRPFSEVYELTPTSDLWRKDVAWNAEAVKTALQTVKQLLPRRVLYPEYTPHRPNKIIAVGKAEKGEMPATPLKDRSLAAVSDKLKGYVEKDLATIPTLEVQGLRFKATDAKEQSYSGEALALGDQEYRNLDFGTNRTGFIHAKITCKSKTRLWFLFDEVLTNGDIDSLRMQCVNIISYEMEPGDYEVETIEPYTFRYMKILCLSGACEVQDVYLREYAHPSVKATFQSSDERLNRIYAAAVETFRQNSLDIFMDCPSRERAGWLCDSFFTSRVALDLNGNTPIEQNFVENFLLPEKFAYLPDGMLPMCYPADHNDGTYIPNWALWFVIQLEEYQKRGGDKATIEAFQPKVAKLLDFFKQYENEDGLLEKLPSWVFVEWSKANEFVQDVNYPSNMLYAGVLDAAARMYGNADYAAKAEKIRETIRRQSFDGQFFVDNAVRQDGDLVVTKNHSEVCQYFAFFFKTATPETYPELWAILCDKFGPKRKETKAFPEVYPANSFIGNVLRLELLSQAGRSRQILDESVAYLLYMVERTGTLWEHAEAGASCDHGFASHALHTLYRDVLGIRELDINAKKVSVQFADLPLQYCEGSLPTPDGFVKLRWEVKGNQIEYELKLPSGYQAKVENQTGKKLVERSGILH